MAEAADEFDVEVEEGPFVQVSLAVLDLGLSDKAERVYIRLRAFRNRRTGRCDPRRSVLADRLRCSVDTIDRALRELQLAGLVEVVHRTGHSSLYRVRWAPLEVAAPTRPPAPVRRGEPHPRGTQVPHPRGPELEEEQPQERTTARVSTKPVLLELEEGRGRALEPYEEEFDRAWRNYPRRTARKRAFRAYQATRRRGVPAPILYQATVAYAAARTGQPQEFTLHGSTFYGPDERWRDYVEVEPNAAAPDAPDLDDLAARAAAGPRTGSRYTTRQPWEEQQ